jgi:clan AA aspartic protease (TIGR02281 family)
MPFSMIDIGMRVSSPQKIFLTVSLLLCCSSGAQAQMYKCKRADGAMTFQDVKCPAETVSTTLASSPSAIAQNMSLPADSHGHFHTTLSINDVEVPGLIDTGASIIAISAETARAMRISILDARPIRMQTANGSMETRVKVIPVLRIGNIDLYNVEIAIAPNSPTLIGMNVLKRFKITQENGQMNLLKQW